jgi:hypothetical protein
MRLSSPLSLIALMVAPWSGAVAEPAYTAGGALVMPADYREWIYMSSGLDMSYSKALMAMGHSMFDNVFVEPAAWKAFKQTGHWPDKAMFVLEIRRAESHGSINKNGQFQLDDVMGVEAHVHDEARFKGGWGFFQFDGPGPGKLVPYDAECYACHQAHGAVDTTFTQFYPTAKPIAVKAGTYHEQ